jgi:hypothetical protein
MNGHWINIGGRNLGILPGSIHGNQSAPCAQLQEEFVFQRKRGDVPQQ